MGHAIRFDAYTDNTMSDADLLGKQASAVFTELRKEYERQNAPLVIDEALVG